MTSSDHAAFTITAAAMVAANTAAREAHIAALVARAPWAEWSASLAVKA